MIQHCPVLIVLLPLTAALLCLLFSKFNKNLGSWLVIGSIAGSLACSLQVLHQTLTSGEAIHYWMGNWEPPLGIEFVIDPLSAVMAVLITFISLKPLTSIFSEELVILCLHRRNSRSMIFLNIRFWKSTITAMWLVLCWSAYVKRRAFRCRYRTTPKAS